MRCAESPARLDCSRAVGDLPSGFRHAHGDAPVFGGLFHADQPTTIHPMPVRNEPVVPLRAYLEACIVFCSQAWPRIASSSVPSSMSSSSRTYALPRGRLISGVSFVIYGICEKFVACCLKSGSHPTLRPRPAARGDALRTRDRDPALDCMATTPAKDHPDCDTVRRGGAAPAPTHRESRLLRPAKRPLPPHHRMLPRRGPRRETPPCGLSRPAWTRRPP